MGVFVAVKKNVNRLFLTTAKVISQIQTGGPWLGAGNERGTERTGFARIARLCCLGQSPWED
jgi:hypothetical protein